MRPTLLEPLRQLDGEQHGTLQRGHVDRVRTNMITRAQLASNLRLPVGNIPFKAAEGERRAAVERDYADVFGEEEAMALLGGRVAMKIGTACVRRADGVVTRREHKRYALLRDEEEIDPVSRGRRGFVEEIVQMMDLGERLVDPTA